MDGWLAGAATVVINIQISVRSLEIGVAVAVASLVASATLWLIFRKRPTPDELELERRTLLVSYGRIVDGFLLDSFQVIGEDGSTREMLLYQYEIAGVVYECSQDITTLRQVLDPAAVRVGMPCSIRYQPGSPENSILVTETWSGLRETYQTFVSHVA